MAKMDENQEKTWGLFCHLAAFGFFVFPAFGNILGPLVIWLIKKDESPYVDQQGKESLNFQISFTIYAFIAGILARSGSGLGGPGYRGDPQGQQPRGVRVSPDYPIPPLTCSGTGVSVQFFRLKTIFLVRILPGLFTKKYRFINY